MTWLLKGNECHLNQWQCIDNDNSVTVKLQQKSQNTKTVQYASKDKKRL